MAVPALAHGCGALVLNKTSTSTLASIQYAFGRALMQLRCKPAAMALLGDLGWEPLISTFEKRQVDYFVYLKNNNHNGLLKKVFNDMLACHQRGDQLRWKYMSNIHDVVKRKGLDDVIYRDDTDWLPTFRKIFKAELKSEFLNNIGNHTSLNYYAKVKTNVSRENYTKNACDFYLTTLKFRARTGCFMLQTDYERWGKSNGICKLCNLKVKDDLYHRILICPRFQEYRVHFYNELEKNVPCESDILHDYFSLTISDQLDWLLGDYVFTA